MFKRAIAWLLCGLACWQWVQVGTMLLPGTSWFPNVGIVVMGLLTGAAGFGWERHWQEDPSLWDPSDLRSFLAPGMCLVAAIGAGWVGDSSALGSLPFGPTGAQRATNAAACSLLGVIATYGMLRVMLASREPSALFGRIILVGAGGFIAPIILMAIFVWL